MCLVLVTMVDREMIERHGPSKRYMRYCMPGEKPDTPEHFSFWPFTHRRPT